MTPVEDVRAWLEGNGLGRFADLFEEHEIDGEVLVELTDDDLAKLGLALGARKKLLKAISGLGQATMPSAAAPIEARPDTGGHVAERRQLTVLFCDLAGSTALSGELDPEVMRDVIARYQTAVAGEISRFEGHVAKYMGDGVLAYFGWPKAHEDDAERAVRAGLALVSAIAGLVAAGRPLAARIGIATGLVVVGELVGEGAAQEEAVVGETPNLAARLQALAEPGSVVIGLATRRLIGGLFELADLGPQRLKGFAEPHAAFRVEGEGRAEGRFEALRGERLMPLVGREHELAMLLERWSWAKDSDGQVVLIAGEAGIGKSRLLRALRERLAGEPHLTISHFCSPYHTNSALHPIIAHLERAAGFASRDEDGDKLAKLEALLGQATPRLAEAVPLIGALLGIPAGDRYQPLNLSPQRQKQRTFEVLIEQLAWLARERPALELYEDLHWADPSTLELLDLVVERVRVLPVLVVITHRPQFSPPWSGQAHVTTLPLNRLGRRQGAAMALRITGGKALPAEILDQILERTDGVPLFVEELTRTVLESGLLTDAGDHYELAGPLPDLAIPATLHDSFMARLDRLSTVKEVAQTAAAIGREFSHSLLVEVLPRSEAELNSALDQLVTAELVFRSGMPPDAVYRFKHALLRDSAYESLLKSHRAKLHDRIATALQRRHPLSSEPEPEVVAHHLALATRYEEAADYWLQAGTSASNRSAYIEAANSLANGLDTVGHIADMPTRLEKELRIRGLLASALRATKGHVTTELEETLRRSLRLASELGKLPEISHALNLLSLVYMNRGDLRQARTHAVEALEHADRSGARSCQILTHRTLGTVLLLIGDLVSARSELEQTVELYSLDQDRFLLQWYSFDPLVAAQCFLGWTFWILGYPDMARRLMAKSADHAERLGHSYSLIFYHTTTALLHLMLRDPDSSRAHADIAIELSEEQRLPYFSSIAKCCDGWARARTGAAMPGISQIQEGLAARQAVPWEPFMLACLAEAFVAVDRGNDAIASLRKAANLIARTGARWWEAEVCRVQGLCALSRSTPSAEHAEVSFRTAIDVARSQRARSWELRAACDLARLWADQGKRREAHNLLAPVYDWFTEGFDTNDLKEAKALLDGVS